MQTPILVGVHGVKQSGKDTVFNFVKEWGAVSGLSAHKRGFADEVKLAVARLFYPDITLEEAVEWADTFKEDESYGAVLTNSLDLHYEIYIEERMRVTLRQMLQHMGTEVGRDMWGEDFWVDRLLPLGRDSLWSERFYWWESFPARPQDTADICGVTDQRFPSELRRLDLLGALTIKVKNEKAEQRIIDEAAAEGREIHRSELVMNDNKFKVTIDNNGTLDELREDVFGMMDWYQWVKNNG